MRDRGAMGFGRKSTLLVAGGVLILLMVTGYWWLGGGRGTPLEQTTPVAAATEEAPWLQANPTVPPGLLRVRVNAPGAAISPRLHGLALEEINHSLDGGLYGELLQNRNLMAVSASVMVTPTATAPATRRILGQAFWSLVKGEGVQASMTFDQGVAPPNVTTMGSLRLTIEGTEAGQRAGLANPGYWGIPVKPGWTYQAALYAKSSGDFAGPLTLSVESNDGRQVFASKSIEQVGKEWKRYEVELPVNASGESSANQFVISAASKGEVSIAMPTLFPPTYNHRRNGNRVDLMEKLAQLHPGYLLYPGGDYMIGSGIVNRYTFKQTIGPVDGRSTTFNRWHRTSNGFGLMEFLLTCEELKAEPILAVYAGTSIAQRVAPGAALEPYVKEALEEIEYVTGDKSTPWGARRAADGHPEPFALRYVQVGNNEQLFNKETYDARFTQFYDAIKAHYPTLQLIGWMDLATTRRPDVEHESFYGTANEIMTQAPHYDDADRTIGSTRYAVEYNAKEGDPTKTLYAALGDAAWLMNTERNSDVVLMAHPAPLFINVNGGAAQHPACVIGYDALKSYGSPTFHVIEMFNRHKGTRILPLEVKPQNVAEAVRPGAHGAIGVGTWGVDAEFKDIEVTAPDGKVLFASDFSNGMEGWKAGTGSWKAENGALRQTSSQIRCTAVAGDPTWTDYTLRLKAKKNSGTEGFLIMVHAADEGNYVWWNIGGWLNTRTGLEQTLDGGKVPLGEVIPNRVESGKWYDVRVDVHGEEIVCYLDDQPVINGTERARAAAPAALFATASLDEPSREVVLKVVNVSTEAQSLEVNLEGALGVEPEGVVEVMAGKPGDTNSVEAPERVRPQETTIHVPGPRFLHTFPGMSVSVMRVKMKG